MDATTGALRQRNNYPADGIAGALTVSPSTWVFDGVAVAPSGAIYVSSHGENVVHRITE